VVAKEELTKCIFCHGKAEEEGLVDKKLLNNMSEVITNAN
jgi:hypothetical protein